MLEFFVPGIPRPAGSKRAFPIRRKDGHLGVAVSDMSGEAGKAWRTDIKAFAQEALGKQSLLDCPIALEITFVMPRPKHHYGKKGLKENAPYWHTSKPDATKMLRCVEDSLKGVLWHDDAQVVHQVVWKIYGENPGALIKIRNHSPVRAASKSLLVPLSPDSSRRSIALSDRESSGGTPASPGSPVRRGA